jgi:hypothetical protein
MERVSLVDEADCCAAKGAATAWSRADATPEWCSG